MSDIVQKLWGFCHTLRHDGIDYGDYIEQITYLLFLKMADERDQKLPKDCDWPTIRERSGTDLTDHYVDVLRTLGKTPGILGDIYSGAQSRFNNPVNLKKLVSLIDETEWTSLDVDVKAAAYGRKEVLGMWIESMHVCTIVFGKTVSIGDVVFTMEAPMGDAGVVDSDRPFSLAQRLLLLRGKIGLLDGGFLAHMLQASPVRRAIEPRATGTTVLGIAYKRLKYVRLPIPPVAEQTEIVRRVDRLFALIDMIDRRARTTHALTQKLPQAILSKAFAGELVDG